MNQPVAALRRVELPGAVDSKLFFAQVREDPLLEIEALQPQPSDTVVVVSSGGCTALSLLAAGAGTVVAVDLSRTQNSLVELKAVAVEALGPAEAARFLGAAPHGTDARLSAYAHLQDRLSPHARAYWNRRRDAIANGVLAGGVTERFLGLIVKTVRVLIHRPSRIRRLLDCRTLEEQRELYTREWNNRRWRLLFAVLLNRVVFRRTYDPAFFANVENPSFSKHFYRLAEHGLTNVPVADNYFLHHMLTGSYPTDVDGGMPPYLAADAHARLQDASRRLQLVDGSYLDYLRTQDDNSINGFSLSNICEWLEPAQVDELMGEIVRTAAPGARLVFRNFVGWTEVPAQWRDVLIEERAYGDALIERDRSMMQRRIAVCRVRKAG